GVTRDGNPVAGARLRVDGYELPAPTNADGAWSTYVDGTLLARHVITLVGGTAQGSITVAYPIEDVKITGTTVTGRLVFTPQTAPPPVGLYSYELRGTSIRSSRWRISSPS